MMQGIALRKLVSAIGLTVAITAAVATPSVLTHSFASRLYVCEYLFVSAVLCEDGFGLCSPYEGLRVCVAVFDPFGDSDFELVHAVERTSSDALPCDLGEQSLDEVEPGAGCRREVEFEARMA